MTGHTHLVFIIAGSLLLGLLLALLFMVATTRRKAEDALKTSEETFRMAIENASIGMALVDTDGRWLKVNKALCDMFGYSAEEFLGTDFQSITHPDDLNSDLALVRQVLADDIKNYTLEKRYFHKSGRIIWALLSVSLVRDTNKAPKYFISQIQDVTEQKDAERIKAEFISIVSHELRTPLTSIRGSLGLILGCFVKDLPQKTLELLDIAFNNCERLILLINDILDIDKIAAGHMRFDTKEHSIAELTEQAVKANESYAGKFNVQIDLLSTDKTITVDVDAARYIQVLSNLLSNAAKFSPQSSVISVFTTLHHGRVRISVQDRGPGIPEDFQSRIFDKFSQAESNASHTKDSTGLGLHISKQLVEHMRGAIGFETELGTGTTFWVEFPISR